MDAPRDRQSRSRGRPRRFVPPKEKRRLSLDEPLAALSPTALSMLAAGRTILAERGFRALTVEAVVNEAGVNRATFAEHFGDRTGFLAILFDSLTHDPSVALERDLAALPAGPGRVEMHLSGLATLFEDVEGCAAYIEIAAGAVHDLALRRRLSELLSWYRTIGVSRLIQYDGADACPREELEALAALVEAAEDGLALHAALDPESVDGASAFALLSRLVKAYLSQRPSESTAPDDG